MIAVDLDGTLSEYYGFKGDFIFGKPIPEMVKKIKNWLYEGKTVKIFTARVANEDEFLNAQITKKIQDWLEEECNLPRLEVTCKKEQGFKEFWDDRAITVIKNTGLSYKEDFNQAIRNYKPK